MYSSIAEILSSSTNLSPVLSQCQGYSKMLRRVTGRKKKRVSTTIQTVINSKNSMRKKEYFFPVSFLLTVLKKNPHIFLSWKLNQLGYLILYPYWILSSTSLKLKWLYVILLTYGFYMLLEPRETHSWTRAHTQFSLFILCHGSYQFFTEITHIYSRLKISVTFCTS